MDNRENNANREDGKRKKVIRRIEPAVTFKILNGLRRGHVQYPLAFGQQNTNYATIETVAEAIEDYGLIGNCAGAALVGKSGSIDWLAWPRFDSPACFAALVGNQENGRWLIAPAHQKPEISRRYRDGALVLETEFRTPEGVVVLTDCMDRESHGSIQHIFRTIRGVSGAVPMRIDLRIRFEYGSVVPWVKRLEDGRLRALAGPDQLILATPVECQGEGLSTVAEFTVQAGQEIPFVLSWRRAHLDPPPSPDAAESIERVARDWIEWSGQHVPRGPYAPEVLRSLITLKALTHHETGGIVAAPTTSLPEELGGARNWDYRFCWLRDATFTLLALVNAGFTDEAVSWHDWLMRAVAGSPEQMRTLYGVAGERVLTEFDLPWLEGYERSAPVRVGNAASGQLQLDVFGEVIDLLYQGRKAGLVSENDGWALGRALVERLIQVCDQPDNGIWEIRGAPQHFTHSKVMAWVAFDRATRAAEQLGAERDLSRWRAIRDSLHAEVCEEGFDRKLNSFVQYYGSDTLDASLLMLPLVGFLPACDPRILGTVAAIEKRLLRDGFVARYNTATGVDGLRGDEGVFLPCSFWLADNYALQGRSEEARNLFEKLLGLCNDVGLLAEEYDYRTRRAVGNFPQAFSHVALVNTAHNLCASAELQNRQDSDGILTRAPQSAS